MSKYFTDDELDEYIDGYIEEGEFAGDGSLKIFPTAKSTEVMILNDTDWKKFAAATGVTTDDLATWEGLTEVAGKYYDYTDALTPDVPNDGKAFFGRDSIANYMSIGGKQLGCSYVTLDKDGSAEMNVDKAALKKLWENYYVPYVKGWFTAQGRFRSEDAKTGKIIALICSTTGAMYTPSEVSIDDDNSYPIDNLVLPVPNFEGKDTYIVQQGAGMSVLRSDEKSEYASAVFLKWFTSPEHNITFSVDSGYLPVTHEGNSIDAIRASGLALSDEMDEVLSAAVDTVNENHLYTPHAFSGGTNARAILEYSMSDKASADRAAVKEAMAQGQSFEEASAQFLSDECFEAWYQDTLASLEAFQG